MFKIIWVIIGCLIGAGFASGKEIYLFFYRYGKNGILGIIITTLILFLIIIKVFKIMEKNNQNKEKINNYKSFLKQIFPYKNGKIAESINIFISIFILLEFYIMISGFGAYLKQEFNIPKLIGASIISCLTYLTCKKSMRGIENANKIIIPILILIIFHMGVINVENIPEKPAIIVDNLFGKNTLIKSIIFSVLYTGYNAILLIPVLIGIKKEQNYINKNIKSNNKNNNKIALFSSIIVGILAICIFRILSIGNETEFMYDIPIIKISKQFGNIYSFIYGIIIAISIYTSAIAICYSLIENLSIIKGKVYNNILKIICISSIFVSFVGFSNLVERIYPLLGIFGVIQGVFLLRYKCK